MTPDDLAVAIMKERAGTADMAGLEQWKARAEAVAAAARLEALEEAAKIADEVLGRTCLECAAAIRERAKT